MKGSVLGRLWCVIVYILSYIPLCVAVSIGLDSYMATIPVGTSAPYSLFFYQGAVISFVSVLISLFLHIIIHELGHMVGGLLTGYRFLSFRIGSLMLLRTEQGFRFKRFALSGTAGQCLMVPPKTNAPDMPTTIYNISGAAANMIFTGLGAVLAVLLRTNVYLFIFFLMFATAGFATAAMNALPMKTAGIANDGYNAILLSGSHDAKRAMSVQLGANAEQMRGVRLKDMPEEWFYESSPEQLSNVHVAAHAMLLPGRLMDEGRLDAALLKMRELLDSGAALLPIYEGLLRCDMAYCTVALGGDYATAQRLLTQAARSVMKSMNRYPAIIRTEYALAISDGRQATANALMRKLEKVARTYPSEAELATEYSLIRVIDERSVGNEGNEGNEAF